MSDRAIPRSFRFMEGFGVHTFRFVNARGTSTFVKFHWKPKQGMQSVLWDEAVKINGADPDFHRRDLWDAIQHGDFPEWELGIQRFDDDFADEFDFDVLDPDQAHPRRGACRSSRSAAWCSTAPSTTSSPRPSRWRSAPRTSCPASTSPTTRSCRAATSPTSTPSSSASAAPTSPTLPINAPKCPMAHFQQDGHMAVQNPVGQGQLRAQLRDRATSAGHARTPTGGSPPSPPTRTGRSGGCGPSPSPTTTARPSLFFRSQMPPSSSSTSSTRSPSSSPRSSEPTIRERMVANLRNVDDDLAAAVADGLGHGLAAQEGVKAGGRPRTTTSRRRRR